MQFRVWLENLIDRETARRIVLDAVGATEAPEETKDAVLSSRVSEQPALFKNLKRYRELHPYLSAIEKFMFQNPNANLITLISFIERLDRVQ